MALLRATSKLLLPSRSPLSVRRFSALSFVPELRASIPSSLPAIRQLSSATRCGVEFHWRLLRILWLKLDYVPHEQRDVQTFQPNDSIQSDVVFANNHLRYEDNEDALRTEFDSDVGAVSTRLSGIDVVGFDYDYTLCHYSEELQHLIYAMARDYMVSKLRYPEGLSVLQYDPSFAIRGLTIDKQKGLLCKISSHQKLSNTAVFRGRHRLSRDEIMELYGGSRHISVHDRDYNMEPLNDLFSVAHACLFADVVQYMIDRDIEYEPIALVEDVNQAITNVHLSGEMHKEVARDLPKYIEPNPALRPLLERIRDSGKKSFLCTNSSFPYINAGLKYMLGDDWRELFDVVIVSARKPKFYTRQRSFRMLDIGHKQVQINKIEELMRSIQNELRSEPVPQNHAFVDQLVNVHEALQMEMENLVNVNFGSVFRADTYPSQFAFLVQRYVDIYSARLEDLLEYPSNHTFYPERIAMPHEYPAEAPR
ncbi:HAD-like domain [Phytophthora cactorum]|nr:HAD-like domain [Phytophthora cactorum]